MTRPASTIGENACEVKIGCAGPPAFCHSCFPVAASKAVTVPAMPMENSFPSKSTPVFFDGKLFSIGMAGTVTAFDAATGKQLWQKAGGPAQPIFTSHAFSPIVDAGRVIFHVGGNNQGALTAFDVETGDVRWTWTGDGPSYGSPVLATIDGVRQLV